MNRRTRKFIGTVIMISYALIYALVTTALADSRIMLEGILIKTTFFLVIGLAWILPLMPLIRWMQRPDKNDVL